MAFASDAHRKWWFANHGGSAGGGGGDPFAGVHFVTSSESYGTGALREGVDGRMHRDDMPVFVTAAEEETVYAAHGGAFAGERAPMPQMSSEEKAAFAAYRGDSGK